MKSYKTQQISEFEPRFFGFGNLFLPTVSLFVLSTTFLVANSNLEFEKKITIFLSTLIFYILFFVGLHFWQKSRTNFAEIKTADETIFSAEVEKQLLALDEASQFFGASLRTADMFRLAASRIREIIPHSASALVLIDEVEPHLKIIGANGMNSREILACEQISRKGLAGVCLNLRKIKTDENLRLEKTVFPFEALKYFETAVAVPLFENSEKIFGVFMLYGRYGENFDQKAMDILEAVGTRLAPLILGSLSFERNLFNALTDSLTNLPNERAFYLILENQVAESQRRREERPLTILSIDIKDFNELNAQFGHAAGDRVLVFVAGVIGKQLRKMDFLARAPQDEFLVVLPTATEATAREIIERIERTFQTAPFEIVRGERLFLKMNIGAASVFKHGETAEELLKIARLKKETAKAGNEARIIWFPKEFVN